MDHSAAQLQRLAIAPEQLHDHQIHLTSDQQHYLCDVLRLGHGDRFIAMNGHGQLWVAELQPDARLARRLQALGEQTELAMPMMLLAAPPKGNHFDQVVRSVTELGVSYIVPLISQRTLLKPSSNRIQRWQRIATEAAEQSHRQIIPKVLDPVSFEKKVMQDDQGDWQRYICTVEPSAPNFLHCLSQALDQESQSGVAVMVGPEGGWTETETQQAQTAGYQAVSLGQRTLRAVTANYMAVSIAIAQIELHTAYPGGKVCTKKSP